MLNYSFYLYVKKEEFCLGEDTAYAVARHKLLWVPYVSVSVLFVADVKITYNTFKSSMVATADCKTIFTVDPGACVSVF